MDLIEYGIYKVKDQYFEDYPSHENQYSHNKDENRPYFLSSKDDNGIIWLLPLSTKVEKYKDWIKKEENRYGECIRCFVQYFMGKEQAVLIGNMIPVIPEYIEEEYTLSSRHYIVRNEELIKGIQKRAKKYLALVRWGKLKPWVDILATEKALLERLANTTAPV